MVRNYSCLTKTHPLTKTHRTLHTVKHVKPLDRWYSFGAPLVVWAGCRVVCCSTHTALWSLLPLPTPDHTNRQTETVIESGDVWVPSQSKLSVCLSETLPICEKVTRTLLGHYHAELLAVGEELRNSIWDIWQLRRERRSQDEPTRVPAYDHKQVTLRFSKVSSQSRKWSWNVPSSLVATCLSIYPSPTCRSLS